MPAVPIDLKLHTFHSHEFESVVKAAIEFLCGTPIRRLPPKSEFDGVGVYVMYYVGNLEFYKNMAIGNRAEFIIPIYVGKAVPPGWRTARSSGTENVKSLYGRLREHANSIKHSRNLTPNDFYCRFMVLEGAEIDLIASVEAQLIRRFRPHWNTLIDGFGNHDPGSGRYNQAKSEWDVLHPGRPWAKKLKGRAPSLDSIIAKIRSKG